MESVPRSERTPNMAVFKPLAADRRLRFGTAVLLHRILVVIGS